MVERMVCSPRALPPETRAAAAALAGEVNPANLPAAHGLLRVVGDAGLVREAIAAVTTKYWHGAAGVRLTVGFLDGPGRGPAQADPGAHERVGHHGQRAVHPGGGPTLRCASAVRAGPTAATGPTWAPTSCRSPPESPR